MAVMRVGGIGAGAGGLVALRHLLARPDKFQAVAFELTNDVGGTWVYTEKTDKDEHGEPVHASMYKNLVTNLPKEVMAFPDFPFKATLPSFMTHTDVKEYLELYANHYNLNKNIQFGTRVDEVKPSDSGPWQMKVTRLNTKEQSQEIYHFDSVIICNGHYSVPLSPTYPGLEKFTGRVSHSHVYRHAERFSGKTVAVVGGGASGQDIMLDVAAQAERVYFCHRKPRFSTPLPDNLTQHASIASVDVNHVTLEDGEVLEVTDILLCTGYKYSFPFLSADCHPKVEEERLTPLYKHAIHIEHPTLGFIGIPKTICPFPMFDCQVKFFLSSLTEDMVLPSRDDMREDEEKEFRWRRGEGMPVRHAHTMGKLQWDYNDQIATLGGFPQIPRVVQRLYDHVHAARVQNLPQYKKLNYKLSGTETFVEVH